MHSATPRFSHLEPPTAPHRSCNQAGQRKNGNHTLNAHSGLLSIHRRRSRLVSVALVSAAATASAQAPSLPGFGSPVKPRVVIVFDSSTSMQVAPDDTFGVVY